FVAPERVVAVMVSRRPEGALGPRTTIGVDGAIPAMGRAASGRAVSRRHRGGPRPRGARPWRGPVTRSRGRTGDRGAAAGDLLRSAPAPARRGAAGRALPEHAGAGVLRDGPADRRGGHPPPRSRPRAARRSAAGAAGPVHRL